MSPYHTTPNTRRTKHVTDKPPLPSIPPELPAHATQHHSPEQLSTCHQVVTQLLPTVGAVRRQTKHPRQQRNQTKPNSFQWPVRRLSDLQWPARRSGSDSVDCYKTPLDLPSSGMLQVGPSTSATPIRQVAYPYDFGSCIPLMATGIQSSEASAIDTSEGAITADSYSRCETFPNLPSGTNDHSMEGILRDIEEQLEGATPTGILHSCVCVCVGVGGCCVYICVYVCMWVWVCICTFVQHVSPLHILAVPVGMGARQNSQHTTPSGQNRRTHSQKEDNNSLRSSHAHTYSSSVCLCTSHVY